MLAIMFIGSCNNKVNVRVLPPEESAVITKIAEGEDIKVTGEAGKGDRVN